jgi:hypothetical protein
MPWQCGMPPDCAAQESELCERFVCSDAQAHTFLRITACTECHCCMLLRQAMYQLYTLFCRLRCRTGWECLVCQSRTTDWHCCATDDNCKHMQGVFLSLLR